VVNENFRRLRSLLGLDSDDAGYRLQPNPHAEHLQIGEPVTMNYASRRLRNRSEPGNILKILDEKAIVDWRHSGPAEVDLRYLVKLKK
jgi:hypothetical protein